MLAQAARECLCLVPDSDPTTDNWGIFHGEIDDDGTVVAIEQFLIVPHEREATELVKNMGDGLEMPVYQMIPGVGTELLQSPLAHP